MNNGKKVDKYQRMVVLAILIVVAIPAIVLSTVDFSPHKLIIQDDVVKIGVKSFKVEDIKKVELLEDIDISGRKKGTGTLTYIRGICKVEGENQDADVYIYKNKNPYIKVTLENGLLIYNDKNSNDTEKTYEKLVQRINMNK